MSKVKTCKFLDANQQGSIILIDNRSSICYDRGILNTIINDYANIDIDEILEGRKKFIQDLNTGKTDKCDGCPCLQIKDENEVNQEKISWLNIASFTTCTLRCSYCYFTKEQLGAHLDAQNRLLMPIVKQFHEKKIFTDNICLAIAGGEPLFFTDIVETLHFLKENYKNARFNLQSNCTITPQVKKIAEALQTIEMPWKNLYTSLDCGTKETFKKIKGFDLFDTVTENILTYAKSNCFTDIQFKYMMLGEGNNEENNLSDKDIDGFCNFVSRIKSNTNSKISIAIDRDSKYRNQKLSELSLESAVKIIKFAKRNNIDFVLSNCGFISQADRKKVDNLLIPLLQKILSVKNEDNHKVLRLLGGKISFKSAPKQKTPRGGGNLHK